MILVFKIKIVWNVTIGVRTVILLLSVKPVRELIEMILAEASVNVILDFMMMV
jgi:hypothetical protein